MKKFAALLLVAASAAGAFAGEPVDATIAAPKPKYTAVTSPSIAKVEFESPPEKDWKIRYSIDSQDPTLKSMVYCAALRFGTSLTLKAAYYKTDGTRGQVVSVDVDIPDGSYNDDAERKKLALSGASVSSSWKAFQEFEAKLAFDGTSRTWFWTNQSTKADDNLTLRFEQAKSFSNVQVLTGKPDYDNQLRRGVLEASEDGNAFTEVAKFRYGVAYAQLKKPVKAVRIRATGENRGWLAIREIQFDVKMPAASSKPLAGINIDYSESPDLAEWAQRGQKDAEEQFPIIVERLRSEGYVPPSQIMMVFRKDKGIAYTRGTRIDFMEGWIKSNPKDTGTVVHELTHAIQQYKGNNPGWLVEGIADYIRWFNWEPVEKHPRPNPLRIKPKDSYQTAAAFLVWVEKKYDKQIAAKMNAHMRENTYKDELWVDYTKKDIDALWKEYIDSLSPKAN